MAETHEEKVWHLPYKAEQIEAAVGKGPILSEPNENGDCYWMVWDIDKMEYVSTGQKGFVGDINDISAEVDRAEDAAIAAQTSADTAQATLNNIGKIIANVQGGGSAYSSDFWLFVSGRHPFLNAGPYRDYDLLSLINMRSELARAVTTPAEGEAFTVYDGGAL